MASFSAGPRGPSRRGSGQDLLSRLTRNLKPAQASSLARLAATEPGRRPRPRHGLSGAGPRRRGAICGHGRLTSSC